MTSKGQVAKDARNLELYNDFKSGKFMIIDLIEKYRVSSQRIYQVVKREQLKDEVLPLTGNDQRN
jgi:Mor family transcriptional regulator